MRAWNSRNRVVGAAIGAVLSVGALAACDTGDGKTLPEPKSTLPPPTVPPVTTDLALDGDGTLASVPIESAPPDDGSSELPAPVGPFALTAPWFDGEPIEIINTCDGDNLSPALSWTEPPAGTIELALAMVDESIVDGPPFVHWAVAGISPLDRSLIEGGLPIGAIEALNFFGNVGYDGPCPPPGDPAHVYRLTLYALNQQVELADGTSADDLLGFVQDVAIASVDVTGTYGR